MAARGLSLASLTGLLCLWLAIASANAEPPTTTEPCDQASVRSALRSFVGAFNRGSFEKLDALFAREPDFQWYSTPAPGERLGAKAKKRGTLIPYLRRRHTAGDEFRLRSFDWNGRSAHWSNFGFLMLRKSPRVGWFHSEGKGVAVCEGKDASLIVLTFGGRPLH